MPTPTIAARPPGRLHGFSLDGRSLLRLTLPVLILGCALSGPAVAAPPDTRPATTVVQPLFAQPLAAMPGKEVTLLEVTYLPGGASLPHRHDADVLVYVLSGSLAMQVDGQPAVLLHRGDTFHEGPRDIHRVSANASRTEPASFLVFMMKDVGRPVSRSVDADASPTP